MCSISSDGVELKQGKCKRIKLAREKYVFSNPKQSRGLRHLSLIKEWIEYWLWWMRLCRINLSFKSSICFWNFERCLSPLVAANWAPVGSGRLELQKPAACVLKKNVSEAGLMQRTAPAVSLSPCWNYAHRQRRPDLICWDWNILVYSVFPCPISWVSWTALTCSVTCTAQNMSSQLLVLWNPLVTSYPHEYLFISGMLGYYQSHFFYCCAVVS